jgi:hypothetical protein
MKGLVKICMVVSMLLQYGVVQSQIPVTDWMEGNETELVLDYISEHDVNGVPEGLSKPLLIYSIQYGRPEMVSLLLGAGANPGLKFRGVSPLMYAAGGDDAKKVSRLLDAGAELEDQDPEGNTAIYYAASNGNLKISKLLVRKGADLHHRNESWQTPYDMAVKRQHQEVAVYLRQEYEKKLPEFRDGPYVKWRRNNRVQAFYMIHDSRKGITRRAKSKFRVTEEPFLMKGFAGDSLDYLIGPERNVPQDTHEAVERVMVIGDIHGGYDSLLVFLRQNRVIDQNLRWTWGDGHLVFVGDIFDRGDKVTEALWLIYRLEAEAEKHGGMVHLILGNHEIMVLTGDLYYVADKYELMTGRLNINYSQLFSRRTILGQWLRSRNTIEKINGHLFVHAGLSPWVIESGLSLSQINEYVRYFLDHPDRKEKDGIQRYTLLGETGPFWYRGYHEDNRDYQHLSEKDFNDVMAYFDAEYAFVGHTNVSEITPLYSNRLFAIDVPFYSLGHSMYGLLLTSEGIFELNTSAERKKIR